MKMSFCFLAFFAMAAVCAIPMMQLVAQDTLNVAATPPGNINAVINGDTLAGGVRAHPNRVYRLTRGSIYQVTEPMKINGSLNIVATAGTTRPPVLAPAILADNSSIDHFFEFIGKGGKVTMSNVYLLSQRADNNWLGWSAGMRIQADSVKLKLRGVIFDGFSESGIRVYAHWTKLDVQDCNFRNHQHSSSWFGGQPFMTDAPNHLDTCKFINNTFLANNSYLFSIRGYDRYSVLEHNTLIYGTVNPFLTRQGSNLHIKNNIFYAMHAMGGNPDHVINSWFLNYPDTGASPIILVRGYDNISTWSALWGGATFTGAEVYVDSAHGVTADMVAPSKRVIDVQNNAYFWPQKYLNFVKAYNDTVQTKDSVDVPNGTANEVKMYLKRILYLPRWMNAYVLWTLNTLLPSQGATVTVSNNMNLDPGFGTSVSGHIDSLIAYVHKICTGTLDTRWTYPNANLYPPAWPLPENLAYTNTALQSAGTDGFALGDLNWFPSQKAAWLLTDVEKNPSSSVPVEYALLQNYPNPFNPSTTIEYQIAKSGMTTLKVYNLLGQEVATLVDGIVPAGSHEVTFDPSRLSSGVYFYTLRSGNFVATKKLMLLK